VVLATTLWAEVLPAAWLALQANIQMLVQAHVQVVQQGTIKYRQAKQTAYVVLLALFERLTALQQICAWVAAQASS
jgi:hypothetical protein